MSRICYIPNCKLKNDDPGCFNMHFFQVPRNQALRKKWAESIKNHFKQDVHLKKYTHICDRHFELKCLSYGPLGKILRLAKGSCPTIFDNYRCREQPLCNHTDNNNSLSDENLGLKDSHEESKISTDIDKRMYENSITKINLELVDFKNENLVKLLLFKSQIECESLQKQLKSQAMSLYQYRKQIKDFSSLVSRLKKRKLIQGRVSKMLEVHTRDIHKRRTPVKLKEPIKNNIVEIKLILTNGLFKSNNVTLHETSINHKVLRIPLERCNFNFLEDVNVRNSSLGRSVKRKRKNDEVLSNDRPNNKKIKLNGLSKNEPIHHLLNSVTETAKSNIGIMSREKKNGDKHLDLKFGEKQPKTEDNSSSKMCHKNKFENNLQTKTTNKNSLQKISRNSHNFGINSHLQEVQNNVKTSKKITNKVELPGTGKYYLKFTKAKIITEGKLNYKFQKLITDVKSITLPTVTWKIKVNIRQNKISSITITNKQELERSVSFSSVVDRYKLIIDNKPAYLLGSPSTIDSPEDIEILLDILEQLEASSQIILYK